MNNDNNSPVRDSDSCADSSQDKQFPQPDLVRQCDVKGVLHTHTRSDDGAHSLSAMVATAREIGLEYLGVSDHIHSHNGFEGLNQDGVARQRDEIEDLKEKFPGFDILQGVEVDADAEGALPFDEGTLAQFDYVIVSLANGHKLDLDAQTARSLRRPS